MNDTRSTAALTLTIEGTGSADSAAGTTVITEDVVAQVAGIATRHVTGVSATGRQPGDVNPAVWDRLFPVGHSRGVSVCVQDKCVQIDIDIIAEYPVPLRQLCDAVRVAVSEAVERFVELRVIQVNVTVIDITTRVLR